MMRNLSPEVQRLLLSSAEGRLLEDDELEVIAEEGDDDETEAEVDEQVEEPDFLSSSPQPKANPRFSPRELTPEFLRPFSAPKRSLLRHGARATPEAEAEAEERRQRRHHEKEMRTSWELMIDTLVKPPTGAAETDDDDTKWLRQRQRADTNTESETITGDQGSDDNDDIGTSDDGWEVGDIDTTGNGGGGLLRSSVERARRVGGQRLHRSNQDDKSSKRGDLDNSDGDATEPGSDSEQQQHGSRAGHRSRDGTRVRRRHSSCDHGQRVSEDFEDAEEQSSSSRRHKRKTNPLSTSSERELTRKVVKKSKARSSRDEYDYEGHLLPIEALRKKWAKGPFPPPPPPAPIIEVVVASPHLKEKELEWVLQDIEVKKTHMSSDLRKSFALDSLGDSYTGRISPLLGSRGSGSLRLTDTTDGSMGKKKKGHRRFHSLFESTGLKFPTPPASPLSNKKKSREEEKKLKVGSPERKLLLASDDSGQQKKRVSFKKSKTQELKTKEKEELLAKNAKQKNENEDEAAAGDQSSPRRGGSTSAAAASAGPKKKERRKDEDEGVEEWERDGHKKERKEKDKASKSKSEDKKEKKSKKTKESKSKKKSKKLKKGDPEQSAFEAVTAGEKQRSRRYYSIQIGESSATKEKDPPTTKPVSSSTIAMPVVTQVGKGGTIKLKNRNAWDALGDELALEIFLHLDTRSLGNAALVCWRFSYLSSSDVLWRRKFESEFRITAVRENHQWTKLYNHGLPRGRKAYRSVRGKRAVVSKRARSKSAKSGKKQKKAAGGGDHEGGKERKKRKKEQSALIDSDAGDSDDSDETDDTDGYDDVIDVDICVGRLEPTTGAIDTEDRDRSAALAHSSFGGGSSREKKSRLEGDRSREKRKKRKSVDKEGGGGTDISSSSRVKRRSKERSKEGSVLHGAQRSESVVRYCLHHRTTRNDATRWKNRYRELMTDILIQRVLLKHTNRVIWGKNSIKGRSAAASDLPPLKQRKSLHLLLDSNGNYRARNADQLSSVSPSLSSSRDSTSSEMSCAATLSAPHTPLSTSSLSSSACVTLRSLPPAFSSPSFYCPYKFRVCSQRGKLLDAAQFGLVSHESQEMSVYVLLYASREDLPSPQMIPFLVTSTTEGVHKEPAYHSTIRNYGGGPEPVKLRLKPKERYSLMTYEPSTTAARIHAILFMKPSLDADIYPLYPWRHSASIKGQWKGSTAGGCINEVTFRHNTFYSLAITKRPTTTTTTVCILLQQKKQAIDLIPGQILPYPCHIGFYVYTKDLKRNVALDMKWKNCYKVHAYVQVGEATNEQKDSGEEEVEELVIIPTTFKAREETKFTLAAFADVPLQLREYTGPKPPSALLGSRH